MNKVIVMWQNILKRNKRLAAVRQMRENITQAKERLKRKLLPEDDREQASILIEELEEILELFSKPLKLHHKHLTGTKYLRERDVDDYMESYKENLDALYDILEERLD